MKKIFYIMALLVLVFGVSCQRDGDVIATMKGDKITRGEFKQWLKSKKIPIKNVMKKKSSQKNYLRRIALEKLSYKKYVAEKGKENKDIQLFEQIVRNNFIAGFYVNDMRESLPFSEVCYDISLIKLPLMQRGKDPKKGMVDKSKESEKIIAEKILPALKKGESFSKLAKKYSIDYSKKKGGSVGFITGKMMGFEIESAISNLKPGEFTTKALKMRNGLYVVRVNKKETITRSNIKSKIKDKKNRERVERYIVSGKLRKYIEGLEKGENAVSYLDKAKFNSPREVLFKVGDSKFTLGEFDNMLRVFHKLRFGHGNIKIDNRRKASMVRRIFSERVICADAIKNGVEKKPDFEKKWKGIRMASLGGAYKFFEVSKNVKVSKKDVLDEYKKNKDKRYYRLKGKKKIFLPFSKVKESIEQRLLGKKLGELRRKWDDDILKKADFKVVESELKGK